MPDSNRKLMLWLALMIVLFSLIVALGTSAEWIWAPVLALLGLFAVKRLGPTWGAQNAYKTGSLTDAHLAGRSPRADMERRWSRLGSARGRLLAGADPQSEQAHRLEYGQSAGDYHSRLTQAHDLQAPPSQLKRKRRPKRKRFL